MKRTVKLTERELKRMISESVKRVLKEHGRGNDWENRKEWGNFEDPLNVSQSIINDLRRLIPICRKILSSTWFKLFDKYGYHPTLAFQEMEEDGSVDSTGFSFESNNIKELINYAKNLKNERFAAGVAGFFFVDEVKDNAPKVIRELYNAMEDGFMKLSEWEQYEERMNNIVRRYVNNKRL